MRMFYALIEQHVKRTLNFNKDQGKNTSYVSFESISGVFIFFFVTANL